MGSDESFSSLKRIAVLRALGGLGDFLCVVPALRALRTKWPDAEIILIGLPQNRALVKRFNHYVDDLLEFPGYPGLPEQVPQLQQIPSFFTAVQNQRFDLAIQMQGSGILTNPITVMLGASLNAGFYLPNHYCPDIAYFLPYLSQESEVRRYLRLLEFLGVPASSEQLEFPLIAADEPALSQLKTVHGLEYGSYVCIHPGASVSDRRWHPKYFAKVADYLATLGLRIVLTGSADELSLTRSVEQAMQTTSLNLAGCTSLGALAALLQGARLLICNDTGVSHLADALQVPSVVIFTSSNNNISRWAPLNRLLHRVVGNATGVIPEEVIEQINILLSQALIGTKQSRSLSLAEAAKPL